VTVVKFQSTSTIYWISEGNLELSESLGSCSRWADWKWWTSGNRIRRDCGCWEKCPV